MKCKTTWNAIWLEPQKEEAFDTSKPQPAQYLRRVFQVKAGLKRAVIYQTAHGLYEFWMNGKTGTEDKFKPGFTSYYKRLQVQEYEVTSLLTEGDNVWAVMLADGWWRGICGGNIRNNFGTKVAYLGLLRLEYTDGTSEEIGTDKSFRLGIGGLLESDMKLGDIYDARLEPIGWKEPGFDDSRWKACPETEEYGFENLISTKGVPVREKEHFTRMPFRDAKGDWVIDFGQNIAGYISFKLRGCKPGQHVEFACGEDFREGAYSEENLRYEENPNPVEGRSSYQRIVYLCKGEKEECYCPQFMVSGFQYVRIRGYEGPFQEGDFTAIAVYSDCRETGDFSCSNPLMNQLVKNSRWSQKGNFLDVPTDCPTRERSPWTGDAQIYAKTATWFMDVKDFFAKWLKDVAAEQCENGKILNIAPNCQQAHFEPIKQEVCQEEDTENEGAKDPVAAMMKMLYCPDGGFAMDGSAGWGDAAVIIPWTMYQVYGDRSILEEQYDCGRHWVDYMISQAKNKNERWADQPWYAKEAGDDGQYIWDSRYHWGEWLEPDLEPLVHRNPYDAITRPDPEVPTAYMAYSAALVSKMAAVLGKEKDAEQYRTFSEKVKAAYNKYLIKKDGTIRENRQAPYVRALAFDLCNEENREKVITKLHEAVVKADYHLNTGFLSTALLLNTLTDHGLTEDAYRILEQEDAPGWLNNVKMDATTIPEQWSGKAEHRDSFNHYSYGAVCDFLFSRIAGIRLDENAPGYKHFILQPVPGGSLTWAKAYYDSVHGKICSAWEQRGDKIHYFFTIPEGTSATVILPDGKKKELDAGDYEF